MSQFGNLRMIFVAGLRSNFAQFKKMMIYTPDVEAIARKIQKHELKA